VELRVRKLDQSKTEDVDMESREGCCFRRVSKAKERIEVEDEDEDEQEGKERPLYTSEQIKGIQREEREKDRLEVLSTFDCCSLSKANSLLL
jgi:hypothetical protein